MLYLIPILVAYLLGGIPFGLLIPRLYGVHDIRRHGSGNIGATNATRVLGFRKAIWVFLGDIAKGAAAVLIARWFAAWFAVPFDTIDPYLLICALAAVLGHLFPIYLAFKGGKGVNTALGAMLALLPLEAALALIIFGLVLAASRIVSLSSLSAAVAFLTIVLVEYFAMNREMPAIYVYVVAALVVLLFVAHRSNIARLVSGTENRFDRKRPRDKQEVEPHA